VTVEHDNLSVEVPRAWSQKATDSQALLVSTDTSAWHSNQTVEGVYLGVESLTKLPISIAAPEGCTAGAGTPGGSGDQQNITFMLDCGDSPTIVEQYREVAANTIVRIQVRTVDEKIRTQVLDSVKFGS
jgi:eukaryotic-like serine/threonine-protein kinase